MKNRLYLLAIISFFSFQFSISHAQGRFDATVYAGANFCQLDGDQAGSYSHVGLRAGIGTSFALSADVDGPWRMVVELAFTNKGSYNKDFNTTLSVSYIEIPLLLSYNAMQNRLRIAAGVAPAVKVSESFTDGARASPTAIPATTSSPLSTGCRSPSACATGSPTTWASRHGSSTPPSA